MTTIRSDNEAYCTLKQEQETEDTVFCMPPNSSPKAPRKEDDSPEYVEINAYNNDLTSYIARFLKL